MQENRNIEINRIKYIGNYILEITFNDLSIRRIDLEDTIKDLSGTNEYFKELLDKNFFQTFKIEHGSLVWNDDLDFSPEFLYESSRPYIPNAKIATVSGLSGKIKKVSQKATRISGKTKLSPAGKAIDKKSTHTIRIKK